MNEYFVEELNQRAAGEGKAVKHIKDEYDRGPIYIDFSKKREYPFNVYLTSVMVYREHLIGQGLEKRIYPIMDYLHNLEYNYIYRSGLLYRKIITNHGCDIMIEKLLACKHAISKRNHKYISREGIHYELVAAFKNN